MNDFIQAVSYVLNIPLFPVGKTTVTLAMILYIVALMWFLVFITGQIRRRAVDPLLAKSPLEEGAKNTVGLALRYATVGIGAVIILNTAGIDMTALTVVAGAIGLGLSLGLQTVARNFVGGVILLAERPIKVGDRIQIAQVTGRVTRIALRATTIKTDDELDVIVPNSDFMNEKVANFTHSTDYVRMSIPVVVDKQSDPEEVTRLLLDVTKDHSSVLPAPPSEVWFDSFGDKGLSFTLRISTNVGGADSQVLRSKLNHAIFKKLAQSSIKLAP